MWNIYCLSTIYNYSAHRTKVILLYNDINHTCVCMYICRKQVFNQTQHFVHLNLSIALLLGLITFVSGIEAASDYRVSNNVIYIIMHMQT